MPFAAPTPNLMLLGRRLIMTGAVEVFQCHHFMVGWPGMIERQEKTHLSQVCLSSQLHHCPVWPEISDESMTGAEIEDEAMDVKYCEPGSNWSVSLKNSPVYCTLSSRFLCPSRYLLYIFESSPNWLLGLAPSSLGLQELASQVGSINYPLALMVLPA